MDEAAKKSFFKALVKVQGLIEPVKKDSTNPHFKSRYASLAAVNDAVMGILTENGFTLVQGGVQAALPGDHRAYLRTTLTHVDGHSMYFDYPLTISENPQHVASSLTYARRYSICALLNLSVEDDDAEVPAQVSRANHGNKADEPPAAKPQNDVVRFIPKSVETRSVEIKNGKKAGSTATMYTITDPNGNQYSTLFEIGGQIAEKAAEEKREISFVVKVNGKYLNAESIRFVEKVLEETPF